MCGPFRSRRQRSVRRTSPFSHRRYRAVPCRAQLRRHAIYRRRNHLTHQWRDTGDDCNGPSQQSQCYHPARPKAVRPIRPSEQGDRSDPTPKPPRAATLQKTFHSSLATPYYARSSPAQERLALSPIYSLNRQNFRSPQPTALCWLFYFYDQ